VGIFASPPNTLFQRTLFVSIRWIQTHRASRDVIDVFQLRACGTMDTESHCEKGMKLHL
jgi:hypothetical protein